MQSRTNNTGYFVAVDGPNGSGKTTVINAIAEKLGLMGYKVKVTREPTNSILGEFVRKYAEGHKGLSIACMVTADRYEHIKNEIEPMLYDGNIVITDRYILSSLILHANSISTGRRIASDPDFIDICISSGSGTTPCWSTLAKVINFLPVSYTPSLMT